MILGAILIAVAALLVFAAFSDWRSRRIPNWIPLAIFALYGAFLAVQYVAGKVPVLPIWSSLAVGAGVTAAGMVLFALNYLGGGDVKLAAALGFWAGPSQIVSFFLVMAIAGGVLAMVYLVLSYRGRAPGHPGAETGSSKTERKEMKIPYGIAVAVAGLFIVNNILTFLLA
jgi:prepilin peptidase CpaA